MTGGSPAGGVWRSKRRDEQRLIINFNGRNHQANRVAWFLMTGSWPTFLIDHEDGDTLNNRWANLREASVDQNASNARCRRDSATGLKGVSYRPNEQRYVARIQSGKSRLHLGSFKTSEEAHAAYCAAGRRLHGEFFNDGAAQ